jgi:nucleotidyltransferase/DNA polymerase involved in DNA repair
MSSVAHEERNRVVLHFDVDAMYVACERELNSELIGVPVGVSQ